jgi:uncharacterized membrane protein
MRSLTRTTILLALMVFGVGSVAGAQVSIRIGPPPQARAMRVQPRSPGAGYVWVDGYYYPASGHYRWHNGYWTRPPYAGATWVAPRHEGQEFFNGYWNGDRARIDHNHRSDRSRGRDYRR